MFPQNKALNYIEVTLSPQPFSEEVSDVLAALLAPLGYDSFSSEKDSLLAYCTSDKLSPAALDEFVSSLPLPDLSVTWSAKEVAIEDWNAEWEDSVKFEPIVIGDKCCIHGPKAVDVPLCKYDIVIAPKMSFGSGHHETTAQILEEILLFFEDSTRLYGSAPRVLDMGTGTGILAILCGMLGADVRAIEIDEWVADNAIDNVLLNNLAGKVKVECGDASLLGYGETYDLILANINRNVLINDMHSYVADLNPCGTLVLSGFYEEDLPLICQCAESLGLTLVSHRSRNNWVVAKFLKS